MTLLQAYPDDHDPGLIRGLPSFGERSGSNREIPDSTKVGSVTMARV